jgi:FtsH-binding integral membrane protein
MLLPLFWIGLGVILSSVPQERRGGTTGAALVVVCAVMLMSWLFVRKHRRHFSRRERWRLITYCAIWVLLLESVAWIYSASVGVVDPSKVGAVAFGVFFANALYAVIIWGAFKVASPRVIDSYLQKHRGDAA